MSENSLADLQASRMANALQAIVRHSRDIQSLVREVGIVPPEKSKVTVTLSVEQGERPERTCVALRNERGDMSELYIAPTIACGMAIADLLLRGKEVPSGYATFPDGVFPQTR